MAKRKATRKDALAVTYLAFTRFGKEPFKVSRASPNFPALEVARDLGLIWFPEPTRASITQDGIKSLADYGVPQQ